MAIIHVVIITFLSFLSDFDDFVLVTSCDAKNVFATVLDRNMSVLYLGTNILFIHNHVFIFQLLLFHMRLLHSVIPLDSCMYILPW